MDALLDLVLYVFWPSKDQVKNEMVMSKTTFLTTLVLRTIILSTIAVVSILWINYSFKSGSVEVVEIVPSVIVAVLSITILVIKNARSFKVLKNL